jgi:H+/Cl- antiporter ClcA
MYTLKEMSETLEEYLGPNWRSVATGYALLIALLIITVFTGGCHTDKKMIDYAMTGHYSSTNNVTYLALAIVAGFVGYVLYIKYYLGQTIKIGNAEW